MAMKEEIINHLDNPRQLEKLYRDNKTAFKKAFNVIYPDIREKTAAQIWNERLNFETEEISWGSGKELGFVIAASFLAGLVAKIPDFTTINPEFFYTRNISFIVFPFLTAYFAWKQKVRAKSLLMVAAAFVIAVLYINFLPGNLKSDTLLLSCIHLPIFLWAALGFTFTGGSLHGYRLRLDFLRYNGDAVVMTTIILIAGVLLSVITIGLFELIGLKIEMFYFKYFGIWGLAASPIIGTYLVRTNPQLVNKVSPVIARVFTPLVLVMLVIYLIAVIVTGKDPYNDREFLIIFNLLLLGVMAIILFSIAESTGSSAGRIQSYLLLGLSVVTILVNGIALSAILFRIAQWGITPNRLAVLGSNLLMLTNLVLVAFRLYKAVKDSHEFEKAEGIIAAFLPAYAGWAMLVAFLFPVMFGFR